MECAFCRESVPKGKGKIFIKSTGKSFPFCSSKCEKNFEKGREPRSTEWTQASRLDKEVD